MKSKDLLTTKAKHYKILITLSNMVMVIILNVNIRNNHKYDNLFYLSILLPLIFVYLSEREISKSNNETNKYLIYRGSIFYSYGLLLMVGLYAYFEGFKIGIVVMVIAYSLLSTSSYRNASKKYGYSKGHNLKAKYCFLLITLNFSAILFYPLIPTKLRFGLSFFELFWPLSLLLILYCILVQIITNEDKSIIS